MGFAIATSGFLAPASWTRWANSSIPPTLPPGESTSSTIAETEGSATSASNAATSCYVLTAPLVSIASVRGSIAPRIGHDGDGTDARAAPPRGRALLAGADALRDLLVGERAPGDAAAEDLGDQREEVARDRPGGVEHFGQDSLVAHGRSPIRRGAAPTATWSPEECATPSRERARR